MSKCSLKNDKKDLESCIHRANRDREQKKRTSGQSAVVPGSGGVPQPQEVIFMPYPGWSRAQVSDVPSTMLQEKSNGHRRSRRSLKHQNGAISDHGNTNEHSSHVQMSASLAEKSPDTQ